MRDVFEAGLLTSSPNGNLNNISQTTSNQSADSCGVGTFNTIIVLLIAAVSTIHYRNQQSLAFDIAIDLSICIFFHQVNSQITQNFPHNSIINHF